MLHVLGTAGRVKAEFEIQGRLQGKGGCMGAGDAGVGPSSLIPGSQQEKPEAECW